MKSSVVPLLVIVVFATMGAFAMSGAPQLSHAVGMFGLMLTAIPLIVKTIREAMRGNFATDAAASLAIVTSVVLAQPIPGLIIVLMQSGGELLEALAHRRATRALSELERGTPRIAHVNKGGTYVDTAVNQVAEGDELLVRAGEIVPVNATVLDGRAHLDTATITGESIPVSAAPDLEVLSGYVVIDGVIRIRAMASAEKSEYDRIVALVRSALSEKAPIHRLADRYAVWFTPLTVAAAVLTYAFSGDATRVLAVLVVATPCPLILATPIAIIGGINRAAASGLLFRGGAGIERLANARVAVFDKTGTLTTGHPEVEEITSVSKLPSNELLRFAAAVELGSSHPAAKEVVTFARRNKIEAELASDIVEVPGSGIRGSYEGREVAVGSAEYIANICKLEPKALRPGENGKLLSFMAVDGWLAGYFTFRDMLRPDLLKLFAELKRNGVVHFAVLSGDSDQAVQRIAQSLGVNEAHGALSPSDKVEHVKRIQNDYGCTIVIGDGTNDAPALAAADVGIAVTSGRGGVAAETADVIMLGSDLTKIGTASSIAHRTLRIAKQSISVGLFLSVVAMGLAAAGFIQPIAGALYQEAVDLGVIVNALRASRPSG